MDYATANDYTVIRQPITPTADALQYSNKLNEDQLLEAFLATYQDETPSDHLLFDSFINEVPGIAENYVEVPEPWLNPEPSRAQVPNEFLATQQTTFMEFDLDESVALDLGDAVDHSDERAVLKCTEPGRDNERIYTTPSNFQKHQGEHTRPYECKHSSCNFRRFGNKAGLTRHCREVHGSKIHYCPFQSCNRHKKGFARRYNLLKHQQHCHGDKPASPARLQASSESSITQPLDRDDELTQWDRSTSEDSDRDLETRTADERADVYSGGDDRIERKLQDLRAKRDKITRDIEMLESAQALVGIH